MKRRTFVLLTSASAAALSIPSIGCRGRKPDMDAALTHPLFLSRICDAKTIREIGTIYRSKLNQDSNPEQFSAFLLADSTDKNPKEYADSFSLATAIGKKISRDFEKGNTIILKGWILSEMEAQQCALFSLTK